MGGNFEGQRNVLPWVLLGGESIIHLKETLGICVVFTVFHSPISVNLLGELYRNKVLI